MQHFVSTGPIGQCALWPHISPKGYEFSDSRQTLSADEMAQQEADIEFYASMDHDDREPDYAGEEEYDRVEAYYAGMAA